MFRAVEISKRVLGKDEHYICNLESKVGSNHFQLRYPCRSLRTSGRTSNVRFSSESLNVLGASSESARLATHSHQNLIYLLCWLCIPARSFSGLCPLSDPCMRSLRFINVNPVPDSLAPLCNKSSAFTYRTLAVRNDSCRIRPQ